VPRARGSFRDSSPRASAGWVRPSLPGRTQASCRDSSPRASAGWVRPSLPGRTQASCRERARSGACWPHESLASSVVSDARVRLRSVETALQGSGGEHLDPAHRQGGRWVARRRAPRSGPPARAPCTRSAPAKISVVIAADGAAEHRHVIAVMDVLRGEPVTRVAFRGAGPAPPARVGLPHGKHRATGGRLHRSSGDRITPASVAHRTRRRATAPLAKL
jgi:hypothetical protein